MKITLSCRGREVCLGFNYPSKKNHCFETWDSVAYMPFNCRESPKYGTNLVNFHTGYQISQIKSIFELFCA